MDIFKLNSRYIFVSVFWFLFMRVEYISYILSFVYVEFFMLMVRIILEYKVCLFGKEGYIVIWKIFKGVVLF